MEWSRVVFVEGAGYNIFMQSGTSEERKGDMAILAGGLLWGLFPVITVLSYHSLKPLTALAYSTLLAAFFFAVILTLRGKWHELKRTDAWADIALTTLFIGVLYYVLVFFGLKYTSPGNAGLIGLLEIFFSYLLFNMWRKEFYSLSHVIGSLFMVAGAGVLLFPDAQGLNKGDVLIILSTIAAPFGNVFQQRARKKISSETIMFARSFLTTILIFFLVGFVGERASAIDVRQSLWFLILNGVVLLGLTKVLWIEGIHRISVTKANALSSVSPLFTLLFAYLMLRQVPTVWQLSAIVPLAVGLILLTRGAPKPA